MTKQASTALFFLLFLLQKNPGLSQITRADSLRNVIETHPLPAKMAARDSAYFLTGLGLCSSYYNDFELDSLLSFSSGFLVQLERQLQAVKDPQLVRVLELYKMRYLRFKGIAQKEAGSTVEALNCFHQYLNQAEKLGSVKGVGTAYTDIALCHRDLEDYKLSYEFSQKSIAILKGTPHTTAIANNYNIIGNYFHQVLGSIDSAIYYNKLAIEIYRNNNIPLNQCNSTFEVVEYFSILFEPDSSIYYLNQAKPFVFETERPDLLVRYHVKMGQAYFQKNNYQQALQQLDLAKELGAEMGSPVFTFNIEKFRCLALAANGRSKDAFDSMMGAFDAYGEDINTESARALNTAFGAAALLLNSTGMENCAFGYGSLMANAIGYQNAAFGTEAHRWDVANNNNAFGYAASFNNTTGTRNSAMGSFTMYSNAVGEDNTAIGNQAMYYALNSRNVALGNYAGMNGDNSNDCTYLGYNADNDFYTNTYTNSTAIGSGSRMTASNQVTVGNSSVSTIGGFANWTNFSDGRFKKEVSENVPGIDFINKLRPVTYHLDVNGLVDYLHEDVLDQRGDGKKKELTDAAKAARAEKAALLETGFIAQEVEAAAQSLGYDFSGVDKPQNETDLYGLRYAAFTVPLVKAVQELDAENKSIKQENELLKQQNENILERLQAIERQLAMNTDTQSSQKAASLGQNWPNPCGSSTAVDCVIPETANTATIQICNETGVVIKEINVAARGLVKMELPVSALGTGHYLYSLFVDGQKVDTKKMVLNK